LKHRDLIGRVPEEKEERALLVRPQWRANRRGPPLPFAPIVARPDGARPARPVIGVRLSYSVIFGSKPFLFWIK